MSRRSPGRWSSLADAHAAARRHLPRPVLDYIDGGADSEESLRGNETAFRRRRFLPRALNDVSSARTATELFGQEIALPLGLAPTGYTRMIHPAGESAVAEAAARHAVPYVLSTMASTSLERVRRGADEIAGIRSDLWFQLYIWKDRTLARDLVRRAQDAGYRVLEVAVDTAVSGHRLRDVRNGLTIPPRPTLTTILDIGVRPRYWTRLLTSERVSFANVASWAASAEAGYTIADITAQFDASVDWNALEEIRGIWDGPLVIKGTIGPQDAARAISLGLDGVHLSNHGGRQLDRSIAPVDLIAPVRAAVGNAPAILVDSGVRHGADIATAVALGADMALIGRPYLWGLAAAGKRGVERVLDILEAEYLRTIQLLGVRSTAELRALGPELLTEPYPHATPPEES